MYAIVLELDSMELLVTNLFAILLVFTELALLLILAIVEQLDTLEPYAKFPFAAQPAFTEEFVFFLKLATAMELDGQTTFVKIPFALTHVFMEFVQDLTHVIVQELDTPILTAKFLFAIPDALILELVFFQTLATVPLPLDGLDPLAVLPSALNLANMVEIALVLMFATVQELDGLEINAKLM